MTLKLRLHPDDPGGGGAGDGGAGTGTGDPVKPASTGKVGDGNLQAQIDRAVEEATSGLRSKRDEILREKRELKQKYDQTNDIIQSLGGEEGIERLRKMHESLQKDELGRLLAEGKHDEWFEKRTKGLRADYEIRAQEVAQELDQAKVERDRAIQSLKDRILESEVRAACSGLGVYDSAVQDVLNRAGHIFTHDPEKGIVIKDKDGEIEVGKDPRSPKSVTEWLTEQMKVARHWFPPSKGADASGNTGSASGKNDVDLSEVRSVEEWRQKRQKLGMKAGIGTGSI